MHEPTRPDAETAWSLQSDVLHSRKQFGKPPYPATQSLQSLVGSYRPGHTLQLPPSHLLRHVQVQPSCTFPVTVVAWLLQLSILVHFR